MRLELNQIFQMMLDKSNALGAGWVDRNGLMIHCVGLHNGLDNANCAATIVSLDRAQQRVMQQGFNDTAIEQVILGERLDYYILHLQASQTIVYAMTNKQALAGIVRAEMHEAKRRLSQMLSSRQLVHPARERLEQPRQFKRLIRKR